MRVVEHGTRKLTEVWCLDEPGAGGACHEYKIVQVTEEGDESAFAPCRVNFQNGPIKESNPSGIFIEDLLVIVIDRLEGFQSGEFACDSNQVAMDAVRGALLSLNARTADRRERGVEGTNQK
jgi:hypothetical protein